VTGVQTCALPILSSQINVEKINYIKNVKLIGGSSVYIVNGEVYYPESIDVNLDRLPEEYRGFFKFNAFEKKIELLIQNIHPSTLKGLTLNLMGGISNNYAHWLSEILPRLFFVLQNDKLNDINILVNEKTHKNLISTIVKLVNHLHKVNIIYVDNGILLNVENLCNVSNIGYCQFEPRDAGSPPYLYLNPNLIRRMALELGRGIEPKNYKKLYLERTSNFRTIINHHEVKLLLEKYGYTTLNTDDLSFDEQVSFFKGAEFIIGPTGAAFANCIFCNDGVNINILTTKNKNHFLDYWPSFLGGNRLNIKYLRQSIYDESKGPSASFQVCLDSLLTVLR
jgi:capsular polysaccharide biosynthesis protein